MNPARAPVAEVRLRVAGGGEGLRCQQTRWPIGSQAPRRSGFYRKCATAGEADA